MSRNKYIGIDIFSGAGGMSIGALSTGIDVKIAVELDKYAATTFKANHPQTSVINDDIRNFNPSKEDIGTKRDMKILFGGPPCQGFSTSNQKTRSLINPNNWLFKEYLRVAKEIMPDWVVLENVKGIVETEGGYFLDLILTDLKSLGYTTSYAVLNAADYGVPQIRNRVFIVGSLHGINYTFPSPTTPEHVSVEDAISDLPILENGSKHHVLAYEFGFQSNYQKKARKGSEASINNLVTSNASFVIERYRHIPQGGNWSNIPPELMSNYKDYSRCHTGIYHRLDYKKPSVVIGNYRKNMLIHPLEDRGLSVREAARIQSFPDSFHFYGSIGFQQQQVGNSVPPALAKVIFEQIVNY